MPGRSKTNHVIMLVTAAVLSWLIPGGGYLWLNEKKRAVIIFTTVVATFLIGIYVGSIGVIDPVSSWPWFIAQIMNSPAVVIISKITAGGGFPSYGKPNEIGQIYTGIAGLLNLLCIVNVTYFAHIRKEVVK